jgi:hypothetical protein
MVFCGWFKKAYDYVGLCREVMGFLWERKCLNAVFLGIARFSALLLRFLFKLLNLQRKFFSGGENKK